MSLLQSFNATRSELLACGASAMNLHISVEYQDQCNFEFSTQEIQAIAASMLPMSISCWSNGDASQ
jgi:hypothetical protein